MKVLSKPMASLALMGLAGLGSAAHAGTYAFGCINGGATTNCQTGALQFTVEVVAGLGGQVQFIFRNVGTVASSIADIYFDDGTLLGIAAVVNGPGVDFSQGATPGNLPGGNSMSPAFEATAGFTADSNPPVQPNGVNPGESVGILFNLQSGGSLADVISELFSRELRIGIHAQGFANGGSESFVNAVTPVPVPAAAWLMLSGLGALRLSRRRNA